jgi:RNA polymerase sigma-54 factor
LTLKDIANEVSVHETTVSRISNQKYVQTEFGIFELKYFFSNSISGAGSSGSRFSKEGVKQVIKEIIEQDGTARSLSDQKIADVLSKKGINLARRTVAKYRKELDIQSSYDR